MAAVGLRAMGDDSPDWETFAARLRPVMARIEAATALRGAPEDFWRMAPGAAEADRAYWHALVFAQGAQPYAVYERQLVVLEKAERLMERVGMPRELLLRAGDAGMAMLAGETVEDDDGALTLIRQLMDAVRNREEGPWAGLPEDVWLSTMGAFARFVNEHRRAAGRYAFDRGFWTTRQVSAVLFRLGTLEYELLRDGDGPYIDLHIPSDADLTPGALNASAAEARRFLAEYRPDWAAAPIRCCSWLLSPALKAVLPEGSRIIRFQAAFDLTDTNPGADDVLQWVFGLAEAQKADARLEDLPGDTTLRRNMKAFMGAGGRVGVAQGVLARPFGGAIS
jgi:hypothetical protein